MSYVIAFLITHQSVIMALIGILLGHFLAARRIHIEIAAMIDKDVQETKLQQEARFENVLAFWGILGNPGMPSDWNVYENFWLRVGNDRQKLYMWLKENNLINEAHDFIIWLDKKHPNHQITKLLSNGKEG